MTKAAYQAAIEWAYETEIPLGLECDVHFSADDELICLHDLTLDRTSTSSGGRTSARSSNSSCWISALGACPIPNLSSESWSPCGN